MQGDTESPDNRRNYLNKIYQHIVTLPYHTLTYACDRVSVNSIFIMIPKNCNWVYFNLAKSGLSIN